MRYLHIKLRSQYNDLACLKLKWQLWVLSLAVVCSRPLEHKDFLVETYL